MVYVVFPTHWGHNHGGSTKGFQGIRTGCSNRMHFIIALSCGAEEVRLGKVLAVRVHSWIQKTTLSA